MIIKLISNNNVEEFNKQVNDMIVQMENENNVLVDTKYKPLNGNNIIYTVLLFFVNPYKEQSKMSSMLASPGAGIFGIK